MRFWPFGKDKEEPEEDVEFVSRVVSGTGQDGVLLRGKITVSFQEPMSPAVAEEIADDAAVAMRQAIAASDEAAALVGQESSLARDASARMRPREKVRAVDVVALHVVSDTPADLSKTTSRPPPGKGPPSGAPPAVKPSSRPPPPQSATSSRPPPVPAPRERRSASSSQMLAVRDSRLIPEGADVQGAAYAIVPLLRDASTRVVVGILRACDLVIVRGMRLDGTSTDDLGDLVPVSTAAPGRFADERRDELSRWEDKLGRQKLGALRTEASAIVCYFLHTSLGTAGVDTKTSTALLEAAAHSAFPEDGPLAALPRYLGHAGDPTDALTTKVLTVLGAGPDALASLTVMLTPVLASLHEDFAFTSGQIKLSGVRG